MQKKKQAIVIAPLPPRKIDKQACSQNRAVVLRKYDATILFINAHSKKNYRQIQQQRIERKLQ